MRRARDRVVVRCCHCGGLVAFCELDELTGKYLVMLHEVDDDGALIDASRTDPSCFSSLFERHFDAVYAFCARRVGNDDAEDIAGETFCRAFASRHRYDLSHPDARPWLFGIALNVIKMALRSGARRARAYERHAGREARHVEMFPHHPVSLDAPAELARVLAALNRLPPDEVETLLLHVWEELSYEEVARTLDVPVGTVRSRLHRARARLRVALDDPVPPTARPRTGEDPNRQGVRREHRA